MSAAAPPRPIDDLREAARLLDAEGSPAAKRVAAGLRRYEAMAKDGMTLDLALNLSPAPGHDAWWTVEAVERRNALIRELGSRCFADLPITRQAEEIAKVAQTYQATAWARNRRKAPAELRFADDVQRHVDAILRAGPRAKVPGKRQLQTILGN